MNTRARGFLLILASVAVSLQGCTPTDRDSRIAAQVEALVEPLVAANEFSGAIVLTRRGKVVYQGGFGMSNRTTRAAFTPETASDGGSLAKTFTAAGVQWLAQEGRVDLAAPVTRYLPEYPHAETSVLQLISHSNGLPPYYEFFDRFFEPTEVRTTEAMLRIVAREVPEPAFPPGSRFEYSNFAFDLAALIIERVTEQTYEEFLKERFFSPLAMNSSFARPARLADWQGPRTLGYQWRNNEWVLVDVFDMEAFLGASNLYFTAHDLARWASANARGTALPAAVRTAGQKRPLIGGQPSPITGLSWYCDDKGSRCYYTGDINAFHGFAYWDSDREEAAVFLSNSSLPPLSLIALQRDLVDVLAGNPVEKAASASPEPIDETNYPAFVGTYTAAGVGTAHIFVGPNGLNIRIDDGLAFDAFKVSAESLYVPGPDYWLSFSGGKRPTALHIRSMFVDSIARRVD